MPLLLNYIDGNIKNKKRENIELLCYNCYFLYVNNPFGCRKTFKVSNSDTQIETNIEELSAEEIENIKIEVQEEIKNEIQPPQIS